MRLVISCPDRPGIVAAVSRFLFEAGANITRSDQYSTDPTGGTFFLRMESTAPAETSAGIAEGFRSIAERFEMSWRVWDERQRKRIAVFVSREDHCLQELIWRWRRGELEGDIVCVISNHLDVKADVEAVGLRFVHVPSKDEDGLLAAVAGACDLVVLARYMQILSGAFLDCLGVPIINIHHSFLPAFPGAAPYERARERGVKLIGATAHYVTEELDAGPIIDQDVIRVGHSDHVEDLKRLGADIERAVLFRAVQAHCQDRVIRHEATTVVF